MPDLEDVITASIEDSQAPVETPEPVVETTPEPVVEATSDEPVAPVEPEVQVPSPTLQAEPLDAPEAPQKDGKAKPLSIDEIIGIPERTPDGTRENRIPYSRVKKIAQKAVREAVKAKVAELEGTYTPKVSEYETKVKDFQTRLDRVAKFEEVMVNKPDQFLQMLSTLPAYKEFFRTIEQAFSNPQGQSAPQAQNTNDSVPTAGDGMPEPDEELSDGSRVYSKQGLNRLLAWQSQQVEARVIKQVEERYKPIESEWQAQQRIQAIVPQVQAQIAEAKTWPLFNENEQEIVEALKADQKLSLEGAYRKVVLPKLAADRNKVREEVLGEVRRAPRATSAPTQASRANTNDSGPRDLEAIIAEQIKTVR